MKWLKPPVFLLCLAPFFVLLLQAFSEQLNSASLLTHLHLESDLGANPVQRATFVTGDTTLIFLCITLAITPLRKITGRTWLIKFRRMFGLFAFFYVCLHFTIYWLDFYYGAEAVHSVAGVMKDVAKRPFITAGFTGFITMLPLALTSTAGWIRRLGGKRWQALHRLIYVCAVAGVVHYWWQVKSDIRMPLLYAVVVGILLGYRVVVALRQRSRMPTAQPAKITAEEA